MLEEIAESEDQIIDQVHRVNQSIRKCGDKIEEQLLKIDKLDERKTRLTCLHEKELWLDEKESLLETIKQNIQRMKKWNQWTFQALDDASRLEMYIKSKYRVKWYLFYYCLLALIGSISLIRGNLSGYFLNLMAVLKLAFALLEFNGLQNWQRHKLLGSLVLFGLEHFLWIHYFWEYYNAGRYLMAFLCLLAGCQIHSDLKSLYNQYNDMKKPRPVILNYPNYKPNAA